MRRPSIFNSARTGRSCRWSLLAARPLAGQWGRYSLARWSRGRRSPLAQRTGEPSEQAPAIFAS
ncbi:UNVERIFIED_CONTAM: hypothetical protein Slati_0932400 [Sesamum latifolium]|uniref:Uncharacterized protein n=1 Tax=Sesamum latifolium TaxID=2727402 RepID=A0AAW2XPF9_9LAMI